MGRPSAVSFAAVSEFDAEAKIGANAEPPSEQAWIALVKATAVRNVLVTGQISKRNDPPPDRLKLRAQKRLCGYLGCHEHHRMTKVARVAFRRPRLPCSLSEPSTRFESLPVVWRHLSRGPHFHISARSWLVKG